MHRKILLTALPPILLVLSVYVWFVSIGTWTRWPAVSTYYNQLATAFSQGQPWLDLKPDPALLALPNPYDPDTRNGLPYLSDASLYQGRYYLYFGPVPALLILPAKIFLPNAIPDQVLVFAFTGGTFLAMTLLLVRVWRRFLGGLSPWLAGIGILGVGLIAPFGWVLGSRASVHDVAISAGQFFLLAGLIAAFAALDGPEVSKPKAILAGIFWAAALGSRITQIIPIAGVLVLIAVLVLRRQQRISSPSTSRSTMLAFLLPVVLGITALGWYNWVRFGSVLETGITYQLALLYLQKYRREIFSVNYAVQNLYNYLLMLPKLRFNFPYIWPRMGIRGPITSLVSLPSLYFAEDITGLVFTAPFLLFAFFTAIARWPGDRRSTTAMSGQGLYRWLVAALGAASLSSFALFLVFFWASERYLLDFVPAALVLSMIEFWNASASPTRRPLNRAFLITLGLTLLLGSVLVSNLLAIAQNAAGFRELNPVLWQQLNNLFRP